MNTNTLQSQSPLEINFEIQTSILAAKIWRENYPKNKTNLSFEDFIIYEALRGGKLEKVTHDINSNIFLGKIEYLKNPRILNHYIENIYGGENLEVFYERTLKIINNSE
jgi:hypothetical protein